MLIDNPEAFKSWLTSVLEPLCDADPEALAKYVFALVKKDKSVEILRQGMLEQLDVFLQHETKPFVELLFKTIESQDYLLIPNTNPPNPNVPVKPPTDLIVKDIKPIIPVSTLPNLSEAINGAKTKPEKEERRRRRSRSRSWDRQKRSKSRERDRGERSPRRGRSWRNKSPPSRRYRRSRSGSPPQRQRSRSRSPRHYRGAQRTYRNRSPPRSVSRSPSRSQERKDKREKDVKDENSGAATPTQDSNHGDTDMRLTSTTQSIQSVVQASGLNQANLVTQHPQNFKKRCRDFDEKGYCMKGELCPYDHGLDPVVLEDSALTTVLQFGGETNPLNPPINPNFKPIVEYNPSAPSMWQKNSFRPKMGVMGVGNARFPNPNIPGSGFFQRELIPVPVSDIQTNKRKIDKTDFDVQNSRKKFDFNRLGPKRNSQNCSLELKKIPKGLNNITHLNNHFSKFGKIVNIQVNYNNDLESALITFSCHSEANSAYKSTEAVLNNRFIKVFWHSNLQTDQKTSENEPPNTENAAPNIHQKSVKDRLGKIDIASTEPQKSEKNNEKHKLIAKNQEILLEKEKLKRKQLEKRKEAIKITQDLRKRKQELLEKQLAQQKLLIEKLEKAPIGAQRDLLKTTIKTVQESIENIRKDISPLVSPQNVANIPPKLPKTKEDAQRELLDTELDLMTRQAEGLDTSALQRRLTELRATALSLSSPQKGGKRHKWGENIKSWRENQNFPKKPLDKKMLQSGVFTTFGGKLGGNLLNLDRRPTGILVSGFELDELTSVVSHFANFGEIKQFIPNNSIPSIVLIYKQRKEAEMALSQGRNFRDRVLSVTWVKATGLPSAPPPPPPAPIKPLLESAPSVVTVVPAAEEHDKATTVTDLDKAAPLAQVVVTAPPPATVGVVVGTAATDESGRENGNDVKVVKEPLHSTVDGGGDDDDDNGAVGREPPDTDGDKVEKEPLEESGADVKEDQLLLEGDDENVLSVAEYTEEALLQDDEEEEETEEDRSWRR